jgi:hypothetical protein
LLCHILIGLLVLLIHVMCENNQNIFTLLIPFTGDKFTPASFA